MNTEELQNTIDHCFELFDGYSEKEQTAFNVGFTLAFSIDELNKTISASMLTSFADSPESALNIKDELKEKYWRENLPSVLQWREK